jgi:hypothetical protein
MPFEDGSDCTVDRHALKDQEGWIFPKTELPQYGMDDAGNGIEFTPFDSIEV